MICGELAQLRMDLRGQLPSRIARCSSSGGSSGLLSLIAFLGILALLRAGILFRSKGGGQPGAEVTRHGEIRLAVVAASLAVPLVGMWFGSPGGFFVVLLSGGPFFLVYLLSVRTVLGSVIAGLALLGLTIASEVYVIGRAASSTAALGYLLIPIGAIPVVAATIMAEALAQPLPHERENSGRRRMSPGRPVPRLRRGPGDHLELPDAPLGWGMGPSLYRARGLGRGGGCGPPSP
jgi:hypothetical protein